MSRYRSVMEQLFNGDVTVEEMLKIQGEDVDSLKEIQMEIGEKLREGLT